MENKKEEGPNDEEHEYVLEPRPSPYLLSRNHDHPELIETIGMLADGRRVAFSSVFHFLSTDRVENDQSIMEVRARGGLQATFRHVFLPALGNDIW